MLCSVIESFMNSRMSALQRGQRTCSVPADGETETSFSQARHWKCIIEVMKPLVVILLLAVTVQAQTVADAARKERERQAKLRAAPTKVVISTENAATKPAEPA